MRLWGKKKSKTKMLLKKISFKKMTVYLKSAVREEL